MYVYTYTPTHPYTQNLSQETTSKSTINSETESLGHGVHPATWWVAERVLNTPKMRLETRTRRGVPNAPRPLLLLNAAETLLADGCAALAGQALQVMCVCVGMCDCVCV